MAQFLLEIITPQRKAFSEEVTSVTVPTLSGIITVLARHMNLFTALTQGEIKVTMGEKEYFLAIGGGFMDVTPKGVSILVSRAVHAHEINETEIEKARQRAEEELANQSKNIERHDALAMLHQSMLELKVAGRLKTRQRDPYRPSSS